MLEIEPGKRKITTVNPWAENKDDGLKRISAGLDKLLGTSGEQIAQSILALMLAGALLCVGIVGRSRGWRIAAWG